jgi:hypothetical protein
VQINLQDRAPLSKTRKLADGRLAAVARFARAGVYNYVGAELGRPDLSTVAVYRPESEVFSEDAMASFGHKTMTLDHPGEPVTASNWKRVAIGYTEGRVARDGGFVEIPLILADAGAVAEFEAGRATELSAGYACELVWGDGIAPDGTPYQATQKAIRGNHIALVANGRAGSECRIGDAAPDVDAADALIAARLRHEHHLQTAYLGDAAPSFDEWNKRRLVGDELRQMALAGRYSEAAARGRAMQDAAYAAHNDRLTNAWKESPQTADDVRNAARAARYR